MKEHYYTSKIKWTGNKGSGTDHYKNYERSHNIIVENKALIEGSSDPSFRGDPTKHNPEELLVSSLSSCHMLWYLHFCSVHKIIVEEYTDQAEGIMIEEPGGNGYFKEVTLNPVITVKNKEMAEKAMELHKKAREYCFIANSVNFPVKHNPQIKTQQ
ncbi:OsmC family protein [Elizabethkingia meningoseptica]|uniref:OsmC family protein n=1 Tax=Elizabethkingia meningoseptica TaxID=238 RepID=UPI0023AE7E5F|nr:OsmC family protein [Elizabethkingia meningoseptica]MDE5436815.1 OsmC family protein [Elizabethkingia meningoseptica]MDE5509159.1 OsmC family protein [Elizabethkingia meningoseptica]MDE5514676.1 OsmC family protein [Elizabethkingia meningoseptica]MDE5525362.1 OsmC family protein [Elizabethkingia meningoseptica]MDE5528942.1 OsmC family protein [Elizabethkingia meningoseptica]